MAPEGSTDNQSMHSSSQARNRGYSLRRSLFTQNIYKHSQGQGHGDVLELEPPSSSTKTDNSSAHVPYSGDKETTTVTEEEEDARNATLTIPTIRGKTTAERVPRYKLWPKQQRNPLPGHRKALSAAQTLRKRFFGPVEMRGTVDGRHVQVNVSHERSLMDERTSKPYVTNKIRSCKYTLASFFPKQLYAQFSKLANFYFLIISILQMVPGLSTTGTFTTIVPLLIFVSLSMAKEGYEDIRRNRLDKEENERTTFVLNENALRAQSEVSADSCEQQSKSAAWTRTKWEDVKVGDVVLIERDTGVPADVVLLQSSNSEGTAHIETKSLDGETNLKSKKPLDIIASHCKTEAAISRLEADFVVEDPNLDLYKFDGRISIVGQTLPLTLNEVVYRGSIVRNTPSALGLVVYSGEECKIRMNANQNPRVKAPTLQAKVNRVVIIVACLVFFVAVVESIGYVIWKRTTENDSWYLDNAEVPYGHVLTSFVIMFNTMLPLSLYVSLEIVKVAQMFMMNDIDMYDQESDTPMEPKTSTLNEELGQVSYIFSDKTGTLTNNSMKFRKMSTAGTAWLHDWDLQEDTRSVSLTKLLHKKRGAKGKQKQGHRRGNSKRPLLQHEQLRELSGADASDTNFAHTGKTEDLLDYIRRHPQGLFARKVRFFILAMALCHTCIPEKSDDGTISFQASSPDELALVAAAQDLGHIVTDRQSNTMTVKTYPQGEEEPIYETYQILDVVEFSSARKRMSILIRLPDDKICLFCKGADTTVASLLRKAALADTHIEEVRRKSEVRRSLEASAVRRRSTQPSRNSVTIPHQAAIVGRQSSVSVGRRHSVRESIDVWLRDRENTRDTSHRDSVHYTPRPSESMARHSSITKRLSSDSPRSSFQNEEFDNLVDEAIVVDDNAVFQRCFNDIDGFATEGLRTLVYGHRFIPEDEYQKWKERYHDAATSLVDRKSRMEKVAEDIEQNLELTGATAIEDKLQIGVPDAIERFRRAGIKMWMLTGDKRETAINIGHSCRLIKDYSTVMILDHESGDLLARATKFVNEVHGESHAHSVLVIDGQTLTVVNTNPALQVVFTELAISADSVICCRASPSQKAGLVKTIRTKVKGSVTLAIGDGANDIAMIQEAHLGIGIAGKEGLQAARTSDYSIGQFRFLCKLLLVHGRWNYVRVCKYTLGTFWKEMLFYLVQGAYQRWTGYTGTSLYEPWSLSMFNTLFTSLPVIFMGVFEKDLAPATLIAVPELYALGQRNRGFNIPLYAWWAFIGAIESMMVYFIMYSIYGNALFTRDNQLFAMGALTYTACVTLISLKLQFFELHNKSITAGIAIFLSLGGWWLWNLILSKVYDPENRVYNVNGGLVHSFGKNILWWMTMILIVLVVSVFEIVMKALKTIYFPNDVETFQVYERDIEIKKRFEESASELLQQGWQRGIKKSSFEIARQEEEDAKREAEIQDILDAPRTMDKLADDPIVGIRKRQSWAPVDLEVIPTQQETALSARKSVDIEDVGRYGFGIAPQDSTK